MNKPHLGIAVVALTMVTVGTLQPMPRSDQTAGPAVRTPMSSIAPDELQVLRARVAHEMRLKAPRWPQRPVTIGSDAVLVPFGPRDPADYKAWVDSLTQRYVFRITQVYVADLPGVPTVAQLEAAKADVIDGLIALPARHRPEATVGIRFMDGVVQFYYEKSDDPAFLGFVAEMELKHGALLMARRVDSVGGYLSSSG